MSVQQQNLSPTQEIYKKISKFIPEAEWKIHAPLIERINKIKKEKNAIILAHNYQTPEIYHGVADISADSLALAVEASKTKADKIIMCGVHFMAETAKLMCPEKKVFLPDMQAGCSLSNSITGEDVKLLKQKFPGIPVVSYVNTSADVKAETDVCCTSANAVKVVESLNVDKVIFLPDQYLADYVAKNTKVKIISWKGTCIVHEQFTGKEIEEIKSQNPGIKIIELDKEQPACMSGRNTFFSGHINFAVSAIKCTPHIIILSAFVLDASTANANESADISATPW